MVTITIVIEGGVLSTDGIDVLTMDNSSALRQSLNRIFRELLNEEVSIVIQMGAGYRNAALRFLAGEKNHILYVDLDNQKDKQSEWFDKLATENPQKPIIISEEKQKNVFFMIQEMEAWILKYPMSIVEWGKANGFKRLHEKELIQKHKLINNKDIESLNKPSHVLKDIIKHFFSKEYNGKTKKIQYGKLKSAPGILDNIDTTELLALDMELQRFCYTISLIK